MDSPNQEFLDEVMAFIESGVVAGDAVDIVGEGEPMSLVCGVGISSRFGCSWP